MTLGYNARDTSLLIGARFVHLFRSPSPPFTPHGPQTSSFRHITLDRWLGAGAIWDAYLGNAGSLPLVVKLTCPENFARSSDRGLSRGQVRDQIRQEISLYTGRLKKLQGTVVPQMYGVAECKLPPMRRGGTGGKAGEKVVWMMLMEYAGEPMGAENLQSHQ